VCGMGSAESLNAAACHDVTFPYFPGFSRHPVTVTSLDGLEVLEFRHSWLIEETSSNMYSIRW